MILETYIATLRHDKGTIKIRIVSFSGEQGARQQITAAEGCPDSAIVQLKKIASKKVR